MSTETHVFGLENFGNTCYCNSVMQALYNIDIFREYIESLGATQDTSGAVAAAAAPRHAHSSASHVPNQTVSHTNLSGGGHAATSTAAHDEPKSGLNNLKSRFSLLGTPSANQSNASVAIPSEDVRSPPVPTAPLTSDKGTTPLVGFVNPPRLETQQQRNDAAHAALGLRSVASETDSLIEQRKRNALAAGPLLKVDHGENDKYGMKGSLLTAVKDLFSAISSSGSLVGVASPAHLIEVLRSENEMFRSSMHQDAQEFLNFLLNRVMEEEEAVPRKPHTVTAREMFGGVMTNEMRCLYCETVTKRNEQFFDFSLDTFPNTSVYHCLQMFCGNEVLGGTNKFYCDTCGSHEEALKRQKVKCAPKILVLHLKRFKFNEELQENTKLLHRVLYSRYLRLPATTDDCPTPEKLYELSSIIVHLGGGPYQGHYVALCKTGKGWLLYDDEIVDKVDDSFVYRFFGDKSSSSCAYLLICQEVSEKQREHDNTILDDRLTLSVSDVFDIEPSLAASTQSSAQETDQELGSSPSSASLAGSVPAQGFLTRYESMRKKNPNKFFGRKR